MAKTKVIVRKQNSDIEAGYGNKEQSNVRALRKLEKKHLLKTREDVLANDFQWVANYPMPMLKEIYPDMPWMHRVDKYYPLAEGGPLYVDTPGTFEKMRSLTAKKDFFKQKGLRYVLLKPSGTPYEDEQELMQCGQHQPTL